MKECVCELKKAVRCLALMLPESVYDDVNIRVHAVFEYIEQLELKLEEQAKR